MLFFFFQAEDGIRDADVTGVQTCALPISSSWARALAASFRISGRASWPARSTADRCSASTPSPRRRTRTPCDGVSPRKTDVFRTPLNFIARSSARMDRITSGPPSAIRSTRPGGTSMLASGDCQTKDPSSEIRGLDTPRGVVGWRGAHSPVPARPRQWPVSRRAYGSLRDEASRSDNRTGTVIGPRCHRNGFADLRRRDGLWWRTCDEPDTPRESLQYREASAWEYRLTRGSW